MWKSLVEVEHSLYPGVFEAMAGQRLAELLTGEAREFVSIEHPFEESRGQPSLYRYYKDGKLRVMKRIRSFGGPATMVYLRDALSTLYIILKDRRRIDCFFGVDALNTFSGLILRRIGIVNKVCFYSIDFSPRRFSSGVLNAAYRILEILATRKSDYVWCCSDQIASIRMKQGCPANRCFVVTPGMVLPGNRTSRQKSGMKIVFTGRLVPEKGVDLILRTMPHVVSQLQNLQLIILGDGPEKAKLQKMASDLNLNDKVHFVKFRRDYNDVLDYIVDSMVGIACYDPTAKYEPYSFPGKIFLYLGCGIPVITTRVNQYADVVQSFGAGVVIDFNEKSLAEALLRLLTDSRAYDSLSANAKSLAEKYDFNNLANAALERMRLA